METRSENSRPATRTAARPSCGLRRTAMSRSAITLRRETTAGAACSGMRSTSRSTPSMRVRTRVGAPASKCTSLAPMAAARSSTSSTRATTGGASAARRRSPSSAGDEPCPGSIAGVGVGRRCSTASTSRCPKATASARSMAPADATTGSTRRPAWNCRSSRAFRSSGSAVAMLRPRSLTARGRMRRRRASSGRIKRSAGGSGARGGGA
ncbi:MAG TPA: hypothetical protein VF832_09290 [Longimicrobiales bacterium]